MAWLNFDCEKDVEGLLRNVEKVLVKDINTEQVIFWMSDIDTDVVHKFYLARKKIIGNKNKEKIILVLNSPGGNIDAAFKLIELLRANCNTFEVVVPFWAKSAATLISLAADNILMTSISELGPLDTQIREPGDMHFKGALDEYKAIMQVRQEAFEAFDHFIFLLLQRSGGMRLSDLVEPAGKFIANLVSPLYNQIDPAIYGKRARQLDVGLEYAKRVLERYRQLDENTISVLAHKLVYEYPSHSFVINFNEAKTLGLPVQITKDELFNELVKISLSCLLCDIKIIGSTYSDEKDKAEDAEDKGENEAYEEAAFEVAGQSEIKSEKEGEFNDNEGKSNDKETKRNDSKDEARTPAVRSQKTNK